MAFYGTVSPGYQLGYKNKIINGAFDIWQRNTTFGPGGSNWGYNSIYHADRWYVGDPTYQTVTRETNDRVTHLPYMFKCVAGSSGYTMCGQRIEDVRTFSGKTATISFWYKSTSTDNIRLYCTQKFGSGGSSDVTIVDNANYWTGIVANTWTYLTATLTIPSVSGKTIGAGSMLDIGIGNGSGVSGHSIFLSEVQFEEGPVATAFEIRPQQLELALCQRYFQTYSYAIGNAIRGGTGRNSFQMHFPTMRVAPSLSYTDGAGTASRVTYHSSNVGNGANHGLTVYNTSIGVNWLALTTDSYTGYDFYAANVKMESELG